MKPCFGAIYPDVSGGMLNGERAGKVFKVRVNCSGMARQVPQLDFDLSAWQECQSCDQYRSCFDLSNAKLAMQRAVRAM